MKLQLTHSDLCEILSKNLGVTVESVEIVDKTKENQKNSTETIVREFPKAHNPDGLTPEQYGASEGYRLLGEDEIKERYESFHIEKYVKAKPYYWSKNQWSGNEKTYTYRTKLSREELTKLP